MIRNSTLKTWLPFGNYFISHLEVGLELQLLLLVEERALGGVLYGAYSSASRLAIGLPAGLNTGRDLMWVPRL